MLKWLVIFDQDKPDCKDTKALFGFIKHESITAIVVDKNNRVAQKYWATYMKHNVDVLKQNPQYPFVLVTLNERVIAGIWGPLTLEDMQVVLEDSKKKEERQKPLVNTKRRVM